MLLTLLINPYFLPIFCHMAVPFNMPCSSCFSLHLLVTPESLPFLFPHCLCPENHAYILANQFLINNESNTFFFAVNTRLISRPFSHIVHLVSVTLWLDSSFQIIQEIAFITPKDSDVESKLITPTLIPDPRSDHSDRSCVSPYSLFPSQRNCVHIEISTRQGHIIEYCCSCFSFNFRNRRSF